MEETWKDIEGLEGFYQISNLGRIKNLRFNKFMKFSTNKSGYKRVTFSKIKKTYSVHRLVAEAFIPNPNNLPEINHKDENKTNNNIDNLEWCDKKYNMNYGTINKRMMFSNKKRKTVLQFDKDGNLIKEWNSSHEIARKLGLNQANINRCCNNKNYKTVGGFIWKFKEN